MACGPFVALVGVGVIGQTAPGIHASVRPWLKSRDVSLLASDAVNDVQLSGVQSINRPVHQLTQVIQVIEVPEEGIEPSDRCSRKWLMACEVWSQAVPADRLNESR